MRRIGIASTFLYASLLFAATPPTLMNYQGVLRSSSNAPLSGSYDMVFRFMDALTGGSEILADTHTSGSGGQVTVSGGLFNVQLGGGTVSGTYSSLADVFRDYQTVYLEVNVGTEPLSPRIRIVSSAYALNASNLGGRSPAEFLDTSSTAQTKTGELVVAGGNPYGVEASGSSAGAHFYQPVLSGNVYLADGDIGIFASGLDSGVDARGNFVGGLFADADNSGIAYVGFGDLGIDARGNAAGGHFYDANNSGAAYVGYGDLGIDAIGNAAGGRFSDANNSGGAYVGYGDLGIDASGSTAGGHFKDTDSTGEAYIGMSGNGIVGYGLTGGSFRHGTPASYDIVGDVATNGTYTILGNGTKSFIQNHPTDKDKVIVYAALEGDEVATYTRGTGRLAGGRARIALGETFTWVTNPDIGLTAHLTPRGKPVPLSVEALSTTELIVRGPEGEDVSFDYVVYGLRIGFERSSIVQEKKQEAPLPPMDFHDAQYSKHPELTRFSALERFKGMRSATGQPGEVDLSRADALRNAVGVFDSANQRDLTPRLEQQGADRAQAKDSRGLPEGDAARRLHAAPEETKEPPPRVRIDESVWMPVGENIEAGDVVVADPEGEGSLRRSVAATDLGVVGIATAAASDGVAPIATSSVAWCKVDAGYGAIRPGDLLTTSPTPGRAMKAETATPGTILGKALERLDSGVGLIRVVITLR